MEILPHSCYNGRENGQSKEVSAVKRRLLPPVPLWRRVSLAAGAAGLLFALAGSLAPAGGPVAIHWAADGSPNGFAGPWILWALALPALLAIPSWKSLTKRRPGQAPLSLEAACAFSSALAAAFAAVTGALALYRFFPVPAIPLAAAGAVFLVFVLFPLAAWLRRRRRGGRKDPYA